MSSKIFVTISSLICHKKFWTILSGLTVKSKAKFCYFALLKLSHCSIKTKFIYNLNLFVPGAINSSLHQSCMILSLLYG